MIDEAEVASTVAILRNDRRNWIDFFSQHRKVGHDFLLVAQNDRMIDRQIRGYIETKRNTKDK